MSSFLIRRTATALLVVFAVTTLSFFALQLAPGDPSTVMVDPRLPVAQQEQLRHSLGLDRPLGERYGLWLKAILLRADLGDSFQFNRPVARVLADHLPPTLLLVGCALLIQFGAGVGLGVLAARHENSRLDRIVRWFSIALYSTPHFWLGLMALLLFSYKARWFPAGHMASVEASGWTPPRQWLDLLHHLALPALVLGSSLAGGVARFVRNSLLEIRGKPFLLSSRAAGVAERRIVWRHALKNALAPVIQLAGLALPYLMSGALVTEVVFSWPGMGRLTFDAVQARDYPLVLGATLLAAVMVVVGNLIADLVHAAVDPRVRQELTDASS